MAGRSKHIDKLSGNICLEPNRVMSENPKGFYGYLRSVSVDRNLSRSVRNTIALSIELRAWVVLVLSAWMTLRIF
jgi:hypothetical protein